MTQLKDIHFLAEALGIREHHAYKLIREGAIKPPVAVQVGGVIRVNPDELQRWIAAGGSGYGDQADGAEVQG